MTAKHALTITSTADLTPAGLAGYSKFISAGAGFLGGVLAVLGPYLPTDPEWTKWVGGIIAFCGFVGVYFAKNKVEPVDVVVPGGQEPVLGVVNPPVIPEDGI